MTTRWTHLDSPVGELLLTADETGALTSLSVPGQKNGRTVQEGWLRDPALPGRPGAARRLLRR